MLSFKQCELARTLTKDTSSDIQINKEFEAMDATSKLSASTTIEKILESHALPFDQGFSLMTGDFASIAKQFHISPATLFCVYMDFKSKI